MVEEVVHFLMIQRLQRPAPRTAREAGEKNRKPQTAGPRRAARLHPT